jgi:uncharacterized protein (TIGR00266 family)
MKCDEIDYRIIGDDLQLVEIELDPNETIVAEAGTMLYMNSNINFETKLGDGSATDTGVFSSLFSAGKRLISGESIFMTHFTNHGDEKERVAFSAPYLGKIIAIDMKKINTSIIAQKGAFLCAAKGTKLDIFFNKKLGSGLFGGEGFILQKIEGDGMAFIHAGGTIIEKELNGETLRVDTGCLVAFEEGVSFDISKAGNLKSMLFGGEGLFLATLSGHGKIWLQSMPISKLAHTLVSHIPHTSSE